MRAELAFLAERRLRRAADVAVMEHVLMRGKCLLQMVNYAMALSPDRVTPDSLTAAELARVEGD